MENKYTEGPTQAAQVSSLLPHLLIMHSLFCRGTSNYVLFLLANPPIFPCAPSFSRWHPLWNYLCTEIP